METNQEPVVPIVQDLQIRSSPNGHQEQIYQAYAVFPLLFSNQVIGTLRLLSCEKGFFNTDNQILLQSYANLAAVAIQNTLLFDEVQAE